jgi:transcription initiation factor TFIID TATA-box-binding protein
MEKETQIKVTNVVATGHLHREVDTEKVAKDANFAETSFNERQSAVVFRFGDYDGVLILYTSGMYMFKGVNSQKTLQDLHDMFIHGITELGLDYSGEKKLEIKNVVCTGNTKKDIFLEDLRSKLPGNTEYEPEQFPAVVYRPNEGESTFLIFSSGKVVITGASSSEVAAKEFSDLRENLAVLE